MTTSAPASRAPSDAPDNVPPIAIFEWNHLASRLNEGVRNKALSQEVLAIGLQIELAQAYLISGRLAIKGIMPFGEPVYDHALALRYSPDEGQRLFKNLQHIGIAFPRWGSNNNVSPPRYHDLCSESHIPIDDLHGVLGAAQIPNTGNRWWDDPTERDLDDYWPVKSMDAARIWFRVMRHRAGPTQYDADPDLFQQLKHAIAWLAGVEESLMRTSRMVEALMMERRRRLLCQFRRVHPDTILDASDEALLRSSEADGKVQAEEAMNIDEHSME